MNPHITFPTATVIDTETGQQRTTSAWNLWDLTEGNFGSCDCNRELLFDVPHHDAGICHGAHRYRVIQVEPMPDGYALDDFNIGYAKE